LFLTYATYLSILEVVTTMHRGLQLGNREICTPWPPSQGSLTFCCWYQLRLHNTSHYIIQKCPTFDSRGSETERCVETIYSLTFRIFRERCFEKCRYLSFWKLSVTVLGSIPCITYYFLFLRFTEVTVAHSNRSWKYGNIKSEF